MSHLKRIAIIHNTEFYFRLASECNERFEIKFIKDIQSINSSMVFNYIFFDSLSDTDISSFIQFLRDIAYTPLIIFLYHEESSIKDMQSIINLLPIHKMFPVSVSLFDLIKEFNMDEIVLNPQVADISLGLTHRTHQIKLQNSSHPEDENSLVVNSLINSVRQAHTMQNLNETIYSILENLSSIGQFEGTGCYLIDFEKNYFFNSTSQIKICNRIPLAKVQNLLLPIIENKKQFLQLTLTEHQPFYQLSCDGGSTLFYAMREQDRIIGILSASSPQKSEDYLHYIRIVMYIYSSIIVPIINNRINMDALKKKNEEYNRTLNDLNHLYDELQLHSVVLDQIREITRKIHSTLNIQRIIEEIVNDVCHLLNTEFSLFYYIYDNNEHISFSDNMLVDIINDTIFNFQDRVLKNVLHFEYLKDKYKIFFKKIAEDTQIIKHNILTETDLFYSSTHHKIHNYIAIPLPSNSKIKGAFLTFNKAEPFNDTDLFMMRALAESGVTAIMNASLVDHLQKMFLNTITTLGATIEARDEYTRGHTERVSEYIIRIAEKLNWTEEQLRFAAIGGILHDIGKIGISDTILNKPGKLTLDEYERIKQHSVIGQKIIENIEELHEVGNYILYHHEKYDGTGYPFGLVGEAIPLEGRITAIADVFDALTSHRVYRQALPVKAAIDELVRCRGTHFDPRLVDIFVNLYQTHTLDDIFKTLE